MKKKRRIFVGVFGATTGFSVHLFGDGPVRQIKHEEIPWREDKKGAIYWPNEWTQQTLGLLPQWTNRGDVIALAMWGADLAYTAVGHTNMPAVQHYRGVPESFQKKVLAKVSPELLYQVGRGANVAFFQPLAQMLAEAKRRPKMLAHARTIVPYCDVMTSILTGIYGGKPRKQHDPVMLQSQGLSNIRAVRQFLWDNFPRLGDAADKLVPGKPFGLREIIRTPAGVNIVPVTHDSVYSRMVGFAFCPNVIWTGTWVGTATQVDAACQPSAESFRLGLSFEGVGLSCACITNCGGMAGTLYKQVKDRIGWNYNQAAENAIAWMADQGVLSFGLEHNADEFLANYGGNEGRALAGIVWSVAEACANVLAKTDAHFGRLHQKEVAVTGGWAQNKAFIRALIRLGYEVHVPVFADQATAAGLAADALLRVGDAKDFAETLEMLQTA